MLQGFRHIIKGMGKISDFIICIHISTLIEMSLTDFLYILLQLLQRIRNTFCQLPAGNRYYHNDDCNQNQTVFHNGTHTVANRFSNPLRILIDTVTNGNSRLNDHGDRTGNAQGPICITYGGIGDVNSITSVSRTCYTLFGA